MEITPLTERHLDAALALWSATEHLGPVPREEVRRLLEQAPDLVLVAVEDDRVLGVVLGSYDGRRGLINRLAVATDARRRGVGRALTKELEDRLARRGCTRVNLLVFEHNRPGRAFWEDAGYQGHEGIVLYTRSLDAAADPADGPGC